MVWLKKGRDYMPDFRPVMKNYKKLTPFKFQILQSFPFIAEDFDSLTNYELLCKVVEYLNDVINNENNVEDNVTALYNSFVELQDYVNEYFDSLDFQEAVNNKLDIMASDGTLEQLIGDYALHKLEYYKIDSSMTLAEIQNIFDINMPKVIEFETGNYLFTDTIRINRNTTVLLNNSTIGITDDPNAQTHHNRIFANFKPTDEFLGYNGNGNIKILNGNISNGSISFCHGKNIELKNINFIHTYADHFLEIAANNNYLIENCTFGGVHITTESRNYVECIQIDDMTRSNFPWFDNANNPTYDSTTNNFIRIKNCKFHDVEGFYIYTCIGGHTYVSNSHKNIYIDGCTFETYNYTAIRPFNWENIFIRNCIFNNVYLRYENDENNFIQKSILSPQRFINNLKFENNYIYGSAKIYFNPDLIEAKNIYINDNTFIKQNISYTLENGVYTNLSNGSNNEAVIILKQITENINICNNKMFDSQLKFLRADNSSQEKKPFINIINNSFNCNKSLGFLHLYEDCSYNICNNVFNLDSVYNDEFGENSNALDIMRLSPNGTFYINKNSYNDLLDIIIVDPNDENTPLSSFKNIFEVPIRLRNTANASGSYNTIYSRKLTDFRKIVLDIGINDIVMANVIIESKKINELITSGGYVKNISLVNDNSISNLSIRFNITDDTHFNYTITSDNETYVLYKVYGLN